MSICFRCNEVLSMCPCEDSSYSVDEELARLRAENEALSGENNTLRALLGKLLMQQDAALRDAHKLLREALQLIAETSPVNGGYMQARAREALAAKGDE